MASIPIPANPFSIVGGRGGGRGEKPDRTRYYACELKWNHWECKQTKEKTWSPAPDTLVTQLIPVNGYSPRFLDKAIITYKLQKSVSMKQDS